MRLKPIIKVSLVASALALPAAAWPLGLGRLTVESYVGQPLSARIELLSATKEELDTLSARVADPALYRQNNLQYQGALSRARVTLERGPGDSMYLRVTSPTPVTEPYLDLLVEANWAAGRVVRDYTFLLDPPGAALASVEPVTPARQGTAPVARAQPPAPAAAAPSAAARAPAAAPAARGDSYEVKRGDTLSKIAKEHKPETATLDQMLVALFKSNANAFDGNNMNRLRSGAIVTIPSAAEVTSSAGSPEEATRTVQVQASDWRTYRDRVAASAPAAAEEPTTRAAEGRIGTAVQERTPAARAGSDQLRVSKDGGARGAAAAAENGAAQAAQLREAQSRIADLEKSLKDMQRLLEMRNPTMAQLQAQGKGAPATPPAPISTAPAAAPAPAATPKAPEPAKVAEAAKVEPAKVEPTKAAPEAPKAVAPEPPKAAAPVEPPKAVEPAKAEPAAPTPPPAAEAPKVTEPPKVVEPPKSAAPKAAPKAPAKEPPGFFDDLLSSTPGWAIGAGILALIAGLVALFAARRRKTTKFEDSIISGTDIKTNTVFGSTGGGVVNTGDNSLASDFSREGLGNIDTDEVDPIAEAEVYLAYGRDAQAEEILKDALKKDPQRQEIYLKLLEIHAQHNKPSAFETVASELYAVSHGQGEVWQKAVALGRQLDPANPMFAEGSIQAPRASTPLAAMDSVDIDAPRDAGLEFKMEEEISISPTSGAKAKSPADILAGAESELEKTARLSTSDFDPDKTMVLPAAGATIAGAVSARAASEGHGLRDSLHAALGDKVESVGDAMGDQVEAAKESIHDKAEAAKESIHDKVAAIEDKFDLDFHLDDAEKPALLTKPVRPEPLLETAAVGVAPHVAPGAAGAPAQLARPAAALELDKLDLSFDPERTTFEDPTPSVLDGQWHDAATKLDLAKAYQEMGDVEGAREILQEVLHEGDDQQKAEAKSLLTKIG